MQSKSLLIAIAAFAVTATGAQAFGGTNMLARAGLTEEQVSAIEEARELRKSGDTEGARDVLLEAGIDEETLRSIHGVAKKAHGAVHEALESGDYEAFMEAIADTPLADIITSEADFVTFKEAHELRKNGELEAAKELFEELGFEPPYWRGHSHRHRQDLTAEQREALQVAKKSNDTETVKAILEEAGVDRHPHWAR